MKKALLIIGMILIFFAGCKKDDILEASKVEMKDVTMERGWEHVKMSGEYSYPQALEGMKILVSSNENMSGSVEYVCALEGKKFDVTIDNLEAGVTYYYRYEYDNGYDKARGDKENFVTVRKPIVVTNNIVNVTKNSAVLSGSVTNNDVENKINVRGFCWSKNTNPTISGSHNNNGSSSGTGTSSFTYNLSYLESNTKYYVRAYARTDWGVVYGEVKSFVTMREIVLPTVTTNSVTNITSNSATCGGNVTSDGNGIITARGICWSTSQNPTINDNKTTDGNRIGSYTSNISNLSENTTYYVRAYATNEKGTSYGEQKSFTTRKVFEETVDTDGNSIITLNGYVIFKMITVEGGTFKMGAQSSDSGGDNYDSDSYSEESPVHSVTLSDYYIGETEVTQELWEAVMGSNPSNHSGYPQRPVELVSWNDCQTFIEKLNQLTGKDFRLPTEAEWEYAARGGNKSQGYKYSGGNTIDDVAWYSSNSSSTHDVKTKQANELGIYDMSGNVWEWCQDWYGSYSSGSQTDPTGPSSGSYRVLRGGSRYDDAGYCRVSSRNYHFPVLRFSSCGFRLILQELQ